MEYPLIRHICNNMFVMIRAHRAVIESFYYRYYSARKRMFENLRLNVCFTRPTNKYRDFTPSTVVNSVDIMKP